MATLGNVKEVLDSLEFSTINELIDEIFNKLEISVAVFDSDLLLQGLCMTAKRCKCYYMLLHGKENQCSIFDTEFSKSVLANREVDMFCDYACRLTMREVDICGEMHRVILFQYNLDDDDLKFNPNNDSKFVPLYKGTDMSAVDYFWKPNVISREERDTIFDFVVDAITKIKSFY
ncbi:MAG: hypothetical protein FWG85_01640 [Bacteroidetes bacterium]|nr:hypothetical protein [Bacteroidota bacterium]